jgi:transcription initiation factor TFIID subunit 1
LQIIAYKLLAKSPGERLKISRLMKYFPDQNELQMRQRLKVSLLSASRSLLPNDV